MANWRRKHDGFTYSQETTGKQMALLDKEHHTGLWKPAVPSWEKEFCRRVGSVSWKKLLAAKTVKVYNQNVVDWDDSACEEAFQNAKTRFWAEINGLSCDISLPDPDIYIDDVDWNNSYVDPDLLSDLEDEATMNSDEEEMDVIEEVNLTDGCLYYLNQCVPCTGWGNEEEGLMASGRDIVFGCTNNDSSLCKQASEDRQRDNRVE